MFRGMEIRRRAHATIGDKGIGGALTINDVAREAGCSAMTVSRVLNDGRVSARTRQVVLDTIARLGYAPNPAARSLAGTGPVRIGLPYSNPSAAYLSEFLLGALEQAQIDHCQLIVVKCEIGDHDEQVVRSMLNGGVDGVLLPPPLSDSAAIVSIIVAAGVPAVAVAGGRTASEVSAVRIDDYLAARDMARRIIELGHRRIGFIRGNRNQAVSDDRLRGFQSALAMAGIADDPELTVQGDFSYRSGLDAATTLLDLAEPPSAIFASNDDMAAATVAAAHRRRLDVPGDVSVCGFDDTMFARSIWPELTTIRQPVAEMARIGVTTLLAAIRACRRGDPPPPAETVLDYLLVCRDSDGPPRG